VTDKLPDRAYDRAVAGLASERSLSAIAWASAGHTASFAWLLGGVSAVISLGEIQDIDRRLPARGATPRLGNGPAGFAPDIPQARLATGSGRAAGHQLWAGRLSAAKSMKGTTRWIVEGQLVVRLPCSSKASNAAPGAGVSCY
jgi:hypothetical protein